MDLLLLTSTLISMELFHSSSQKFDLKILSHQVFNLAFRNPLIFAILIGLLVNYLAAPIPSSIWNGLSIIKDAALPTALFALGGTLYQYRPEGDGLTICFIIFVSIILHPAIVYFAGMNLLLNLEQLRSAVITAAMAPGINAFLFASIYKKAQRVVASSILIGTIATVCSASFWILIL